VAPQAPSRTQTSRASIGRPGPCRAFPIPQTNQIDRFGVGVDPQKALFLGRDANEKKIKETDLGPAFASLRLRAMAWCPGANGLTAASARADCAGSLRASGCDGSHHGESG